MGIPSNHPELLIKPVIARTLSDQATEWLRAAIQSGVLVPGAQLVERELAAQLGISRVPVREAIHRLADEGLVKRTANRGAMVYLPSIKEIEEITSIRIVLEQFVVERMMQRWTLETEAALRAIVDAMRAGVADKDRPRLANLDTEFHVATWHTADHAILVEVVSSLRQRVVRLLNETIGLMTDDELASIVVSHERLIGVLSGGDVAQARQEIDRHIALGKERILAVNLRRTQS
jgi:DNA-binding GntR family transcriptional regulator